MSAPLDDLMGNSLTEPIVKDSGEEIEVSIVEDSPDEDVSGSHDDEIQEVGGRVSKRINKLKYEFHEERRSKESAERMREEAVSHAQRLANENEELKGLIQRGEKVLLSEIKSRTESDLTKAREEYRQAYEAGDTDAILKAQESLTRSQYETEMASQYQPEVSQRIQQQQAQQQAQQQEKPVDPKLQSWLKENDWFGKDEELTSFAYGVHEKLVAREGVDPRSEEYYKRINDRMRSVFPEKFGVEPGEEEPSANSRTSTVVASASRSSGKPRKVQMTSTQVALAKRLGITPEQYAKQLLKEVR